MSMKVEKAIEVLENESCYECSYGTSFGASECKCPSCDIKNATMLAISALEEIQQYRAIGTVSEFRELKEKATAKVSYGIKCPHCNFYTSNGRYCCNCGKMLIAKSEGKE